MPHPRAAKSIDRWKCAAKPVNFYNGRRGNIAATVANKEAKK